MSLDISLMAPRIVSVFDANYTHNVTPMWKLAGCYDALYNSDGKMARQIAPTLSLAVKSMKEKPSAFVALNPINGWGDYDSALQWLEEVLNTCVKNPDAIIGVSK